MSLIDGPYLQHQGWIGRTMPEPQLAVKGRPYHPGASYIPRFGLPATDRSHGLLGLGLDVGAAPPEDEGLIEGVSRRGREWVLTSIRQLNDLGIDYGRLLKKVDEALEGQDPSILNIAGAYLGHLQVFIRERMADIRETRDWLYVLDDSVWGSDPDQAALPALYIAGIAVVTIGGLYAAWNTWVVEKNDALVELCKISPAVCPKAADNVGSGDVLGVGRTVQGVTQLVTLAAVAAAGFFLWKAVR